MKTGLAELGELAAQLERLRGAVEDARRGRESRGRGRASARGTPQRRSSQPESRSEPRARSSGFVEFSGAQLMVAPEGAVIELADATGVRLTIRLAAGQPLDVAAVAALFCGAQR